MGYQNLTMTLAALGLAMALVPASTAMAQGHGGQHGGGGGHSGGQGGGGHGGGGHGGGYGGGGYGGGGYGGVGFGLGAILGYYAGRPYYCRHHRHWRWSNHQQRYVYYNGYGAC